MRRRDWLTDVRRGQRQVSPWQHRHVTRSVTVMAGVTGLVTGLVTVTHSHHSPQVLQRGASIEVPRRHYVVEGLAGSRKYGAGQWSRRPRPTPIPLLDEIAANPIKRRMSVRVPGSDHKLRG
jgi:hypothetical protein